MRVLLLLFLSVPLLLAGCTDPSEIMCTADLDSDRNNCGACGYVCPYSPNSNTSCERGECVYGCVEGAADCNGDPTDGCEALLADDAEHCGACDNACPASLPHSVGACRAEVCSRACAPGWGDCNFPDVDDGCEADLATDSNHCGSCSNLCPGGCVDGLCPARPRPCEYFTGARALSVASDGERFLLVWSDSEREELRALPLDETGHAAGEIQTVLRDRDDNRFSIAHDGTDYVLVYRVRGEDGVRVVHLDDTGVPMADPTTLATTEALYGVRAHSGAGEVLVAVGRDGFLVGPGAPRALELPGDYGTWLVPTGDGYVAVGRQEVAPRGQYLAFDATGAPIGSPEGLSVGENSSVTLASTGAGAVLASLSWTSLTTMAFDATGSPVGDPDPTWHAPVPVEVGSYGLGASSGRAWIAYTAPRWSPGADGIPSPPLDVELVELDAEGRAVSTRTIATPRGGEITDLTLIANAQGVLVLWVWRTDGSYPWPGMNGTEGVFVQHDGALVRPCDEP